MNRTLIAIAISVLLSACADSSPTAVSRVLPTDGAAAGRGSWHQSTPPWQESPAGFSILCSAGITCIFSGFTNPPGVFTFHDGTTVAGPNAEYTYEPDATYLVTRTSGTATATYLVRCGKGTYNADGVLIKASCH